jgi:hypothetical protein
LGKQVYMGRNITMVLRKKLKSEAIPVRGRQMSMIPRFIDQWASTWGMRGCEKILVSYRVPKIEKK